jgi:DNA-binding transcriptional MerR regulator
MSQELRWTVEELVELSSRLLPEEGGSRRVRWNPNPRLVRYYTTLGLLDRPFGVRGQVVHYGPRHLLQLLTVKALQAYGEPLQEIQERTYGQTDHALQSMAGLPDDWLKRALMASPVGATAPQPRPEFWAQRPPEIAPTFAAPARRPEPTSVNLPIQGIELASGMTLLLDRRIYPDVDVHRLRQAALTLLAALEPQVERR